MATSRHLQIISGVLTEVVTDLTGGAPSALYKVRTAGTGYSVDHTLMAIALVSQASPFTVSLKWVNLNTGLEVVPNLTHLQFISADVGQKTAANSMSVVLASDQALPLPTGAATAAKQPAFSTIGTSSPDVVTVQGAAGAVAVPVSMSNVPLPTGAATAAKQPAFGTAGSAAVDVVTIQGIAGGVSVLIAGNIGSGATDSGNPVKVGGVYNSTLPTLATGQRSDVQVDDRGRVRVSADAGVDTYSAAFSGAVTATAGTDVFTITGAAGKKVTVTKIGFNATQTTAGTITVGLVKRSTANSANNSTLQTAVPHKSGSPAASATVRVYTGNPVSLGTLVGKLRSKRVFIGTATSLFNTTFDHDFCENGASGVELLGVNEVLAINFGGVNVAGNSVSLFVEWTEE